MLVVRALKISQLTDGGMPPTYDSMHLYRCCSGCRLIVGWVWLELGDPDPGLDPCAAARRVLIDGDAIGFKLAVVSPNPLAVLLFFDSFVGHQCSSSSMCAPN